MRLPGYEREVGVAAQSGSVRGDVGAAAAGGAALAAAGARLTDGLARMGERAAVEARRQEERAAVVAAGKVYAEAGLDWTRRMMEAREAAPEGAPDFTDAYLKGLDEDAKARVEAAPEAARLWLEGKLVNLRAAMAEKAMVFEAGARLGKQTRELNDIVGLHANGVRSDADRYGDAVGAALGAIEASSLAAGAKAEAKRTAQEAITVALLQGVNERDPAEAKRYLDDGRFDHLIGPERKNALVNDNIKEQARRRDEAERRAHLARVDMRDRLRDTVAAMADGRSVDYDPGRIRAVLGPEEGGAAVRQIEEARALGRDRTLVRFATPDQVRAVLEERGRGLDDPDVEGYRGRAQAYETVVRAVAERERALAQDPAAYVQQAPAVRAAAEAAAADPGAVDGYVRAALAEQERLGVPAAERRVLARPQAERLVGELQAAAPERRADLLQATAAQYGRHWPRVFRELLDAKLPADYQVLATTDAPVARAELGAALGQRTEDLRKSAGPNAKAIDDQVAEALAPVYRSLAVAPNGQALGARYEDAIRRLAYRYAATMEPDAAATRAAEEVVLGRYDFVEQGGLVARAPRGQGARVLPYAERLLETLRAEDLADIGGNPKLKPRDRQEIALSAARRGAWVTTEDESGWLLLDVNRQPVLRADGSRVEFRFSEVSDVARRGERAIPAEEVAALARRAGISEEQARRNLERARAAMEDE